MASLLLAFMLVCVVSSSPYFPMGAHGPPMAGPMIPMSHPPFASYQFGGPPGHFLPPQMQMSPMGLPPQFRGRRRPRILVAPKGWRKTLAARLQQGQMLDPRGSASGSFDGMYRQFDRPDFRVGRRDFRQMPDVQRFDRPDMRRVDMPAFRRDMFIDQRDRRRDYQIRQMDSMRDRARREAMRRRAFVSQSLMRRDFDSPRIPSMGRMGPRGMSLDISKSVGDLNERFGNIDFPSLGESKGGIAGTKRILNAVANRDNIRKAPRVVLTRELPSAAMSTPVRTPGSGGGIRLTGPRLNNRRDIIDLSNVAGPDVVQVTADRTGTMSIAEPMIDLSNVNIPFVSSAGGIAGSGFKNEIFNALRRKYVNEIVGELGTEDMMPYNLNIGDMGILATAGRATGQRRAASGAETEISEVGNTNMGDIRNSISETAVAATAVADAGEAKRFVSQATAGGTSHVQIADTVTAPGGSIIGTKPRNADFTNALLRDTAITGLGPIEVLTLSSEESFRNLEQALMGQSANQEILSSVLGSQGGEILDSVFSQRSDLLNSVLGQDAGSLAAQAADNFQVLILDADQLDQLTRGAGGSMAARVTADGGMQTSNRAERPVISRAGSVLGPDATSGSVRGHGDHGPDGHSSVGRVGKPVGSIEMGSPNDVVGLFSVPPGSNFPNVPKSVSSIPSSIGWAMKRATGHSRGHT